MLMQNFGVTDKDHYGMFWYFLEWSIQLTLLGAGSCFNIQGGDFNLVPRVSRLLFPFWRDKRPWKRDWVLCTVLFLVQKTT